VRNNGKILWMWKLWTGYCFLFTDWTPFYQQTKQDLNGAVSGIFRLLTYL